MADKSRVDAEEGREEEREREEEEENNSFGWVYLRFS